MLSVSSFNQHCKGNIITVRGKSDIPCPVCSGFLKVHGTCIRKVRLIDATRVYRLRVMECTNCHRTHRELPDFIVPYKRYGTEAIIDIVELPTDQCVCETSTQEQLKLWIAWFFLYAQNVFESQKLILGVLTKPDSNSKIELLKYYVRLVVNSNFWSQHCYFVT